MSYAETHRSRRGGKRAILLKPISAVNQTERCFGALWKKRGKMSARSRVRSVDFSPRERPPAVNRLCEYRKSRSVSARPDLDSPNRLVPRLPANRGPDGPSGPTLARPAHRLRKPHSRGLKSTLRSRYGIVIPSSPAAPPAGLPRNAAVPSSTTPGPVRGCGSAWNSRTSAPGPRGPPARTGRRGVPS